MPPARARLTVPVEWRPRIAVAAGAMLVAALLGVFAFVLATSQATSRREAEDRFGGQATIAAALIGAIFSATDQPEAQAAAASYGAATITSAAVAGLAHRSHLQFAVIAGSNGAVIAASPGTPASVRSASSATASAVQHAFASRAWLSALLVRPGVPEAIEQAISFQTRFGRRVEVLGYPARVLSAFFNGYLVGALPGRAQHGFIVDGNGRIVASSVQAVRVGRLIRDMGFLRALTSRKGAYHAQTGGSRYLVAAPIQDSDWRVAITEPTSALYPALVGSRQWVLWVVFAAFAMAALVGLYLYRRTLQGAAQRIEQARLVDETNDALRAANAELDAFSYSVSHDLRAPLRAIDGFSLIVLEEDCGQLTDSQRRCLGIVRDNNQRMGGLIDDLLTYSRLANQPLERRRVSTPAMVGEIESDLIGAADGTTVEFSNGRLPEVNADPVLLRRVYVNLIDNAIKYSRDSQPPRVIVDGEQRDGEVVFRVSDNGVGFDMRYAGKLFQVFQRLHKADEYPGTGVGLAIVHRIVTRHGGRVWAEAELGAGATFHFTLGKDAT
jgi:signal transduction histidine kinase